MPNLPQHGIELVAQGASAYIADVNKAARATDDFTNNLSSSGNRANAFGEVVTGALRRVGEVALDALGMAAKAAGQFLADSVTSAADVEQTLNVLGATSGATAAQLEEVRDVAIKLGGDLDLPNASAQDAAEAMLELSKAGFTVQESMAAAKGTLQLAAAAQIDAGEAAAITAQAINSFGLEASDAAHVADLLAGGANASSASMTDLAQGLQQGGFAFDAAGQDIDQLVVSLAALTNVGLTGSDAGTALKNAMMRLMNPTDEAAKLMNQLGIEAYDAQGNMKPWPEVLETIRAATAGMTQEQRNAALGTIFLSDGMKAMIPLLDMSAAEYEALTANVTKAGSAQTVAGAQTQGFNGAIAGLQSQLETLQLIIGTKVLPLLTPLIAQFSAGVSVVAEWANTIFSAADPVAALSDQFPILGEAIDVAMEAFDAISGFVADVMPTIMGIVKSVLTIMSALWKQHGAQWTQQAKSVFAIIQGVIKVVMGVIQGILAIALGLITGDWSTAMNQIRSANEMIWNGIRDTLMGILDNIASYFGTTADAIVDGWANGLAGLASATSSAVDDALSVLAGVATQATAIGRGIIEGIISGINGAIGPLVAAAANAAATALDAAKKALGISSPSKVFKMEVGYNMSAGIAEGVTAGQGLINKSLASVTAPIARPSMGSSSNTVNNSRTVNYSPTYGGATKGSPTLDLAIARSLAV